MKVIDVLGAQEEVAPVLRQGCFQPGQGKVSRIRLG
jgi:hypothetical protein